MCFEVPPSPTLARLEVIPLTPLVPGIGEDQILLGIAKPQAAAKPLEPTTRRARVTPLHHRWAGEGTGEAGTHAWVRRVGGPRRSQYWLDKRSVIMQPVGPVRAALAECLSQGTLSRRFLHGGAQPSPVGCEGDRGVESERSWVNAISIEIVDTE